MVGRLIDLWLAEDIGACDLTCQVMIDPDAHGAFRMNAREPMTVPHRGRRMVFALRSDLRSKYRSIRERVASGTERSGFPALPPAC